MPDERIPGELQSALLRCDDYRAGLDSGLAWAEALCEVPAHFADPLRARIEMLVRLPPEVSELYRRGTLTLGEALRCIEWACDLGELMPGIDLPKPPSSTPEFS